MYYIKHSLDLYFVIDHYLLDRHRFIGFVTVMVVFAVGMSM